MFRSIFGLLLLSVATLSVAGEDCSGFLRRLNASSGAKSTGNLQEELEADRHAQWVQSWKDQNGEKPRWKTTDVPGNPLGSGGENPPKHFTEEELRRYAAEVPPKVVDITKVTDPKDLPEKIRETTRASAEIAFHSVAKAQEAGVDLDRVLRDWSEVETGKLSFSEFLKRYPTIFDGSDQIHKKWLENNSWLPKDDPLRKPFEELPIAEQKKDTDFIIDAMRRTAVASRGSQYQALEKEAGEKIAKLREEASSNRTSADLLEQLTGESKTVDQVLARVKSELNTLQRLKSYDEKLVTMMERAVRNIETLRRNLSDLQNRELPISSYEMMRDLYQKSLIIAEENLRRAYLVREYQLWKYGEESFQKR